MSKWGDGWGKAGQFSSRVPDLREQGWAGSKALHFLRLKTEHADPVLMQVEDAQGAAGVGWGKEELAVIPVLS